MLLMAVVAAGLFLSSSFQVEIQRVEKSGLVPAGLENELKKGFLALAKDLKIEDGQANGKAEVNGSVKVSKKMVLKLSGNSLKPFSTFFGELLDALENQNNSVQVMLTVTGKDPVSKEMTNKLLVQLGDPQGRNSFLGAVEYPFRGEDSRAVPKFIQSEDLDDVLGFLGIDGGNSALKEPKTVGAFQRGEASGELCAKCSVKTEIVAEDEEIRKFQMQLEFLGRRIKDLLKAVKAAKGPKKSELLGELKKVRKQQSDLEDELLERELAKAAEKERLEKEKEDAIRKKVEAEIWEKMAEIEAGKLGDLAKGTADAQQKLSGLEEEWRKRRAEREKRLADFEKVKDAIKDLEGKLGNLEGGAPGGAEDLEKGIADAEKRVGELQKKVADGKAALKEAEKKMEEAKNRKAELEAKEKDLEGDLGDLEKQGEISKKALADLDKKNADKKVELEGLKKLKQKEANQRAKLTMEIQRKLQKIRELTEQKKKEDAARDELENDLDKKRAIVGDLEDAINDQEKARDQVKDALENQEKRRKDLQTQFEGLDRRIEDLRSELEKEEKLRDALENDIVDGREEEKRLGDELKKMRDRASSLPGDEYADRVKDLQDQLGKVGQQIKDKEKLVEDLKAQIEQLLKQLEAEREKRNLIDGEIQTKNKELEGLKAEVEDKKEDLRERQDQVKDLGRVEQDLVKMIDEMNGKINSNLGKLQTFEESIADKQKELENLTKEVEELENNTLPMTDELPSKIKSEDQPKVKNEGSEEEEQLPVIEESSGKVPMAVGDANRAKAGMLHEYELQLTDVSEELTFTDLKSFAEREPGLRQQVLKLEEERQMGEADRLRIAQQLGKYEDQWKSTREVYWKEKELRAWTEAQTKTWEEKLRNLQTKLTLEEELRRTLQNKGLRTRKQIEELQLELTRSDMLMQEAQREYDQLADQLARLMLLVEQKKKMEEELRMKNFRIKRQILEFKKKGEEAESGFPSDAWKEFETKRTRRTMWSSPTSLTRFESVPLDNSTKTSESGWQVVRKRAFVNGKEVNPSKVSAEDFGKETSLDAFMKSNGFGQRMDTSGYGFEGGFKLPVLNSSNMVKSQSARVDSRGQSQKNRSAGVSVKRRIKQATFRKKGGADIFN